jgi:uridine kinase
MIAVMVEFSKKEGGFPMIFEVKKGDYRSLPQLVNAIDQIPRKQSTLLIGIDGCGGSGKSTLANVFKECCANVTIVHMDDFYFSKKQLNPVHPTQKPVGADVDWERVFKQVIEPISQGNQGYYQRYDWDRDLLAEWHTVPAGGIVVIEGVYSTREELADYYDFTIWVDCPRELRLSRGIERDGEEARQIWEDNWMIGEDIYMEEHKPQERANLVVKG